METHVITPSHEFKIRLNLDDIVLFRGSSQQLWPILACIHQHSVTVWPKITHCFLCIWEPIEATLPVIDFCPSLPRNFSIKLSSLTLCLAMPTQHGNHSPKWQLKAMEREFWALVALPLRQPKILGSASHSGKLPARNEGWVVLFASDDYWFWNAVKRMWSAGVILSWLTENCGTPYITTEQ